MAYGDHVQGEQSALQQASVSVGGALGVVAYFLGFVPTYLLKIGAVDNSAWAANDNQLVGWLFYRMHHVDIVRTVSGSASETETIAMTSLSAWDSWLVFIPPVALLLVGIVAAMAAGTQDIGGGIVTGASLSVGYLGCLLTGYALFGSETSSVAFGTTATIGPDVTSLVLTAGVIYPIIFGSIGGAIGSLYLVDSS